MHFTFVPTNKNYKFKLRKNCDPKLLWVRSIHTSYNPQMAVKVLTELITIFPNASLFGAHWGGVNRFAQQSYAIGGASPRPAPPRPPQRAPRPFRGPCASGSARPAQPARRASPPAPSSWREVFPLPYNFRLFLVKSGKKPKKKNRLFFQI